MPRPIVTFTTDFGLNDHFAGTMKGVVLGVQPLAQIVDITHEITPYETGEAAFTIAQAYRYFPKGTVHVVVVDPGVGSARRPILCEAAGQYFVAPDNGVLSMIYRAEKHKVRVLTNTKYFLKDPSRTFHGRDVFAPVAAHLAKKVKPALLGKLVHDYVQLASAEPVQTGRRQWTGVVLKVDRFGNMITNFRMSDFEHVKTSAFEFAVGLQQVRRLALYYAEAFPGDLFAIAGSSGYIEIAMNQSSAAKHLGCGPGSPVELTIF